MFSVSEESSKSSSSVSGSNTMFSITVPNFVVAA